LPGQADAAGGVAGPDRDRRDAGVAGERRLGLEPGHARGLADELGCGQHPDAGQGQQRRGRRGGEAGDPAFELIDPSGQLDDVGQLVTGQLSHDAGNVGELVHELVLVLGQVQ
jgi:hypothetical protein